MEGRIWSGVAILRVEVIASLANDYLVIVLFLWMLHVTFPVTTHRRLHMSFSSSGDGLRISHTMSIRHSLLKFILLWLSACKVIGTGESVVC
jgi:hypothetical protein